MPSETAAALWYTPDLDFNKFANKLIIGSDSENNLPLLQNRYVEGKTLIYVCVNKACKLPVEEVEKAVTFIKE